MSDSVEQIKEKLSILDVISPYVELKKAGKHFKGKSPFSSEKSPSFFVSPDRGMYYCFSTNQGGDMFTFVEKMEGVDFKGALTILAEKAGVELVPIDAKKRDARDRQYTLIEEATKFFFKQREERKEVTEYVEKRGVTGETMHKWRIGYAPDEWRALKTYLEEKKYSKDEMKRAGLVKDAGEGKEPYDVFRDRVMFPLFDSSGRVVAFSGRTLKKDDETPKYVNSPETELFQKSDILYGYDKAKEGIRRYDFSLIVEGQFDVVLAHQAGYTNTVAVSGTALTPHHVMLLERLSEKAVLSLDADRAGIAAAKRSSEIMLGKGMDVKVATMPEGKDPADMIQEGEDGFKKIIGTSKHVVEFLLAHLKKEATDDRKYKLRVRDEVLPLVASIPNRIDQDHFVSVVGKAIDSPNESVRFEVDRIMESTGTDRGEELPEKAEAPHKHSRKNDLSLYLYAFTLLDTDEFKDETKSVKGHLTTLLPPEALQALQYESPEEVSKLTFLIEKEYGEMREADVCRDLSDKLTDLSRILVKGTRQELQKRVAEAEREGDDKKVGEYLTEIGKLSQKLEEKIVI